MYIHVSSFCSAFACVSASLPPLSELPLLVQLCHFLPSSLVPGHASLPHSPITGLSLFRPSWTSCMKQGSCIPCPPGWSCTQQSALMSALPTCWASRVRQPGFPLSGLASYLPNLSAPTPWLVLDPTLGLGKLPPARPPSLPFCRLYSSGLIQVLCGGVEGSVP